MLEELTESFIVLLVVELIVAVLLSLADSIFVSIDVSELLY